MSASRSALIVGASGLVGGHCLDRLLACPDYDRVVSLVRRPLGRSHGKLVERVVDFEALEEARDHLRVDDVYVCLGTTIKAAGTQARFYRVDHDYVVAVGKLAREGGASRIGLVSSVGAAEGASNFYLRVKGETERDVRGLGYPTVEVARPSFLLGERMEHRRAEAIVSSVSRALSWSLVGALRRYRPIEARDVGHALVAFVLRGEPGVHVRSFEDLVREASVTFPRSR